jgi:Tfp pilus assembly protein PilV
MKKEIYSQSGQTLLEVLLAFSIAVVVLGAVVVGINTSLSSTQHAKNQNLANSYAQEGMLILKSFRDSGIDLSLVYPDLNYCMGDNASILDVDSSGQSCGQNVAEVFSRQIKFEHDNAVNCEAETGINGSKVTVSVSWSDSRCPGGSFDYIYCHNVELISCIFDNEQVQSP